VFLLKQPIFLLPVFQERIWGGSKLRDLYGYDIPSERTGECWAISAHPNGQSVVRSGEFAVMTLGQLWEEHRELFGNYDSDRFPLLTKILDANDNLSVQVHPNDEYAYTYENGDLGKTECWYVIDCAKDAEIIFGHHARTKEELVEMIENGQWDKLLRRVKVKPGDFFYVPSGTIHGLCSGLLILETQQSSDTTYRVYDYDRRDKDGHLRELHLEKAIDVSIAPYVQEKIEPAVLQMANATITTYIEGKYFTVYRWDVHDQLELEQDKPFMHVSVIAGEGMIKTEEGKREICKGDHFILPYQLGTFQINGNVQMIVLHP
jgi:mannose-6-phosphate isomerase